MNWLNYHHLHYFWVVAKEGTIAAAAEKLHLTHPTISKQLGELERTLGDKLLRRSGRNLELTDFGQHVFTYADEIFAIGRELQGVARGGGGDRPTRFNVGITQVLPKLVACKLMKPAFELEGRMQVICREGDQERLLADLAVHRLDLVLTDSPIGPTSHVRAFNHPLGECGVTFFAERKLAAKLKQGFPGSLDSAPMLMPAERTSLRRELEAWFTAAKIRPRIIAEIEDTALTKVFGEAGYGVFASPTLIEVDVCRQHEVGIVGRTESARERFFAISVERRVKHPAVLAICRGARDTLFE